MVRERLRGFLTRVSGLALLLTALAAELPAQSKAISTQDLARRAEVVAVGKVSGLASQWNESHSRIFTRVTLSVDQYIKGGTAGQPLSIVVPGGEVDGVGEVYSHTATFRRDESVLVFAEKDRQGNYGVSAGREGKFSIRKDDVTGIAMVGGNMTLEQFTASVRKLIEVQNQK